MAECGYASARRTFGISSCTKCPPAESIPPADTFSIRTTESVGKTHTLADLKGWVTAAEQAGGGWVNIVFHKLSDSCGSVTLCVPPSFLRDFVAWLAPRAALGTHVKTMQEVLGGTPEPAPALHVVAPNGGETLSADADVEVRWTTVGEVAGVDVAYTVDEGITWSPIAAAANTGSLRWRVPPLPGARARVRVSSTADGAVSDTSDAAFHIAGRDAADPITGASDGARGGCSAAGGSISALSLCLLVGLGLLDARRRSGVATRAHPSVPGSGSQRC